MAIERNVVINLIGKTSDYEAGARSAGKATDELSSSVGKARQSVERATKSHEIAAKALADIKGSAEKSEKQIDTYDRALGRMFGELEKLTSLKSAFAQASNMEARFQADGQAADLLTDRLREQQEMLSQATSRKDGAEAFLEAYEQKQTQLRAAVQETSVALEQQQQIARSWQGKPSDNPFLETLKQTEGTLSSLRAELADTDQAVMAFAEEASRAGQVQANWQIATQRTEAELAAMNGRVESSRSALTAHLDQINEIRAGLLNAGGALGQFAAAGDLEAVDAGLGKIGDSIAMLLDKQRAEMDALEQTRDAVAAQTVAEQAAADAKRHTVLALEQETAATTQAARAWDVFSESVNKGSHGLATIGRALTGTAVFFTGEVVAATKAAIDWETAWTGVRKTVAGSGEELASLESELRGLATSMPLTHKEIAGIAQVAGQLGIEVSSIKHFTETMAMLGTATDLSAEEATMAMSKFLGVLDGDIDTAASTIVHLGNNMRTTESDILAMAQKMSGSAKIAKLTATETLALAAAVSSIGPAAEAGGTAMARITQEITKAVTNGGDRLAEWAQVAGMEANQFAAAWREGPANALVAVVNGLAQMDAAGQDVFGTLKELKVGNIRTSEALLGLAGDNQILAKALGLASDAVVDGGKHLDEYALFAATAASRLKIATHSINDAGISIGQTFLPLVAQGAELVADFAKGFADLPPILQQTIGITTAAAGVFAGLAGGALMLLPRLASTGKAITELRPAWDIARSAMAAGRAGVEAAGLTLGKFSGAAATTALRLRQFVTYAGPVVAVLAAMKVAGELAAFENTNKSARQMAAALELVGREATNFDKRLTALSRTSDKVFAENLTKTAPKMVEAWGKAFEGIDWETPTQHVVSLREALDGAFKADYSTKLIPIAPHIDSISDAAGRFAQLGQGGFIGTLGGFLSSLGIFGDWAQDARQQFTNFDETLVGFIESGHLNEAAQQYNEAIYVMSEQDIDNPERLFEGYQKALDMARLHLEDFGLQASNTVLDVNGLHLDFPDEFVPIPPLTDAATGSLAGLAKGTVTAEEALANLPETAQKVVGELLGLGAGFEASLRLVQKYGAAYEQLPDYFKNFSTSIAGHAAELSNLQNSWDMARGQAERPPSVDAWITAIDTQVAAWENYQENLVKAGQVVEAMPERLQGVGAEIIAAFTPTMLDEFANVADPAQQTRIIDGLANTGHFGADAFTSKFTEAVMLNLPVIELVPTADIDPARIEIGKLNGTEITIKPVIATPDTTPIYGFKREDRADGGAIFGGVPGKDSVPALLMPGEHVLTVADVKAMGGQSGVYAFREALGNRVRHYSQGGKVAHFADGGASTDSHWAWPTTPTGTHWVDPYPEHAKATKDSTKATKEHTAAVKAAKKQAEDTFKAAKDAAEAVFSAVKSLVGAAFDTMPDANGKGFALSSDASGAGGSAIKTFNELIATTRKEQAAAKAQAEKLVDAQTVKQIDAILKVEAAAKESFDRRIAQAETEHDAKVTKAEAYRDAVVGLAKDEFHRVTRAEEQKYVLKEELAKQNVAAQIKTFEGMLASTRKQDAAAQAEAEALVDAGTVKRIKAIEAVLAAAKAAYKERVQAAEDAYVKEVAAATAADTALRKLVGREFDRIAADFNPRALLGLDGVGGDLELFAGLVDDLRAKDQAGKAEAEAAAGATAAAQVAAIHAVQDAAEAAFTAAKNKADEHYKITKATLDEQKKAALDGVKAAEDAAKAVADTQAKAAAEAERVWDAAFKKLSSGFAKAATAASSGVAAWRYAWDEARRIAEGASRAAATLGRSWDDAFEPPSMTDWIAAMRTQSDAFTEFKNLVSNAMGQVRTELTGGMAAAGEAMLAEIVDLGPDGHDALTKFTQATAQERQELVAAWMGTGSYLGEKFGEELAAQTATVKSAWDKYTGLQAAAQAAQTDVTLAGFEAQRAAIEEYYTAALEAAGVAKDEQILAATETRDQVVAAAAALKANLLEVSGAIKDKRVKDAEDTKTTELAAAQEVYDQICGDADSLMNKISKRATDDATAAIERAGDVKAAQILAATAAYDAIKEVSKNLKGALTDHAEKTRDALIAAAEKARDAATAAMDAAAEHWANTQFPTKTAEVITVNRSINEVVSSPSSVPSVKQAGVASGSVASIARAAGGVIPGVPPVNPHEDNVLMWGRSGEFMQSEPAVKFYGTPFMEAINRRAIPKDVLPRFNAGGQIGKGRGTPIPANGGLSYVMTAPNVKAGTNVTVNISNPVAEKSSVVTNRALAFAASIGLGA
jgi:TP901 family phage tail tape measure protein